MRFTGTKDSDVMFSKFSAVRQSDRNFCIIVDNVDEVIGPNVQFLCGEVQHPCQPSDIRL